MPYTPTNWENREVEKPRTFTMTNNPDGTVTLTPAEGTIITAGTPIVAENMNKIESQLVALDNHTANTANPHAVTAAQVGALSNFTRFGALLFRDSNASYTTGGQRTINFNIAENTQGGLVNNAGNSITVPREGFALITVALNLTDITLASGGWVVCNVVAGGRAYRIGGVHFTSNGNISINGSIIVKVNANDAISVTVAAAEDFTVIGLTTEVRSFVAIRELV